MASQERCRLLNSWSQCAFSFLLVLCLLRCVPQADSHQGGPAPNREDNVVGSLAGGPQLASSKLLKRAAAEHASPASSLRLAETPQCASDLKALCAPSLLTNNFNVLDCVQNAQRKEDAKLSDECHHERHSQGQTIECLSKASEQLSKPCRKEILHLARIQGEDFHLDRPLFFACREDRQHFCANVASGEGRVYRCLLKHRSDRDMSQEVGIQFGTTLGNELLWTSSAKAVWRSQTSFAL
ncbi:hypothetical protein HPB47_010492 [Ixodes persulcatus]|uniref:Uncharacterized protein n=1 Tax=Ixodes persulcatus TaxID=34615 RepID=A0AC60NZ70_IXOPE|nr:hypothetical protein HPB47_010492 [Ixodes persulcatus]